MCVSNRMATQRIRAADWRLARFQLGPWRILNVEVSIAFKAPLNREVATDQGLNRVA